MRFLHTADWHIGKGLKGKPRLDEQEKVIAEILDIATREQVDCLLLAGDLFDSQAPSAEAERLVFHFLAELAGRRIAAVILGGNHDHPKRLAAMQPVLERLQIHVRAEVQRPDAGGIVELTVREERALIAVMPWVWIHRLTPAEMMLGPQEKQVQKYEERMAGMMEQLTARFEAPAVNILLAHLYVFGAELSGGSEKAVAVSWPYAVPPQVFPETASYIALGHLHRYQEVNAGSPAFYSGSPLQLDFGEQGQLKRVVVVDASPGMKAKMTPLALVSGRQLRDVEGTMDQLRERAEEWQGDYLRVKVKVDGPRLGLAEEVREMLPDALEVTAVFPRKEKAEPEPPKSDTNPKELFADYYRREKKGPAPEPVLQAFEELYEEATRASR